MKLLQAGNESLSHQITVGSITKFMVTNLAESLIIEKTSRDF